MDKITSRLNAWNRRFNLHIVTYFSYIDKVLKGLTLLVSLLTIVTIFYYHGHYISEKTIKSIELIINGSIIFYLFKYLLYSLYSIKRKDYLRQHIVSGLLLLFLIINFFIVPIFSKQLELFSANAFYQYYSIFLQLFFLTISIGELLKASTFLSRLNLSPSAMMLLSFVVLISIGTALLMMPRMTTVPISFIDALFTSTSASCVTGLTVLGTGSTFTFQGHVVIMLLFQFGGISILSFATFFTSIFSQGSISLRQTHQLRDMLSTRKTSESISLLKEIIIVTVLIEIVGTLSLFWYWGTSGLFSTTSEAFFYSLFHATSAFNNAGFSLWDDNLANPMVSHTYFPQLVVMILVTFGSLGFFVIRDLFNPAMIAERRKFKWKTLMPSTYIVLYTTFFILIVASILFFIFEYHHSLRDLPFFEKCFASLFQVTSRTSGFNTVDMHHISVPALLIIMLGMFIGASPGSTAGGIKTTTAFVLFKSFIATIKQYKRVEFRKRTIPFEIVSKSHSIVVSSFIIVFISVLTLSVEEPGFPFIHILFESISAFSTCGYSMGIAAEFSELGKATLIVNMLIGRIGTLSIAFALSKRMRGTSHEYPSTYFMVG